MTTYRLWPSTNGPSTPTNYSGNFISGLSFCSTAEAWFQGYWWWVCPDTGGSDGFQRTTATKFALWQVPQSSAAGPQLVPGSVVTSGTLTAGQWNYVPLATPIRLSLGGSAGMTPPVNGGADASGLAQYIAAAGCNGPFPDSNNYWGAGQTAPDGITSGPLTAFSAPSASMPAPYPQGGAMSQGSYSVGGSDPSTTCPQSPSNTDNFWLDVQVADYATAWPSGGTSLRLWPSFPIAAIAENNDTGAAVSGTPFTLSQPCTLDRIWMFSPSGSTGLATRTGIWDTDTQTEVSGTDNSSPAWKVAGGGSASAGSGWIYVDYTSAGINLPAGDYCVAYFNGGGQKIYYDSSNYFFAGTDPVGGGTVGGPGWNGISAGGGILTAPAVANGPELTYDDGSGTKRGATQYTGPTSHVATTTWTYPIGFEASADWGETRWADVEVTPVPLSGSGLLMACFP